MCHFSFTFLFNKKNVQLRSHSNLWNLSGVVFLLWITSRLHPPYQPTFLFIFNSKREICHKNNGVLPSKLPLYDWKVQYSNRLVPKVWDNKSNFFHFHRSKIYAENGSRNVKKPLRLHELHVFFLICFVIFVAELLVKLLKRTEHVNIRGH